MMLDRPLLVGRPHRGDLVDLLARIPPIVERGRFSNDGPCVREFEGALAARLGVRHCIAMCSGTQAMWLTLHALEVKGEVIQPSFTFVSTAHMLHQLGAQPVFADVEPDSHTLDPAEVEHLITDRTGAIVATHLWGRAAKIDRLLALAARSGIPVIFDAAHAFACSYRGQTLGGFGAAEVFSFHATKVLGTGEGGAVATNDLELARRLQALRNFGRPEGERVLGWGTNAKLPELSAALGLSHLGSLNEFIRKNRRVYERYASRLDGVSGVSLIKYGREDAFNYHYIVIEWDETVTGLTRDALMVILRAEQVITRRYFHPGCHACPPFSSMPACVRRPLLHSERLATQVLVLPGGAGAEPEEVDHICDVLRCCAAHGGTVAAEFRSRGFVVARDSDAKAGHLSGA